MDMNPQNNLDTFKARGIRIIKLEKALANLIDACDRLMGDTDLDDDQSFEFKTMQEAINLLKSKNN